MPAHLSAVIRLPDFDPFFAGVIWITFNYYSPIQMNCLNGGMTKIVANNYLVELLTDTHARTLELLQGLDSEQIMGPRFPVVNPLLWEIGHVAWFYEQFILRMLYGYKPVLENGDSIYDSIAIEHSVRWDLPLLRLEDCLKFIDTVRHRLIDRLEGEYASEQDSFIYQFAAFHQDMHNEAYSYTRQTLAYPTPDFSSAKHLPQDKKNNGPLPGDAEIPGGRFTLGSGQDAAFLFDNEKWSHEVTVCPFRIARATVTNQEYAAFVEDDGYRRRDLWHDVGWTWRSRTKSERPVYWIEDGPGKWLMQRFDQYIELPAYEPVIHVNWYEASAYCNWAKRRLPTEIEWEVAAAGEPDGAGALCRDRKRLYPWGNSIADETQANLDGRVNGCIDVAAWPAGDSAFGCRQMLGNVWEWTYSTFDPYPGFKPDAYREYSEPVFGTRKVLRGGAWATRSRMVNNMYRNFFTPERRDILAGFRTCALFD